MIEKINPNPVNQGVFYLTSAGYNDLSLHRSPVPVVSPENGTVTPLTPEEITAITAACEGSIEKMHDFIRLELQRSCTSIRVLKAVVITQNRLRRRADVLEVISGLMGQMNGSNVRLG